MKLQVLIATMNKNDLSFTQNIFSKNKFNNFLTINQLTDKLKQKTKSIENLFCYEEQGISNSRNRAISHSDSDICLIADDDIVYVNNFENIVKKAYQENPDADIITFQMQGKNKKIYQKKPFVHSLNSLRQVSSVEISFKLKSIKKYNLQFDTDFGIGAKYPIGEEALFLRKAYKKGLKIIFYPVEILLHPHKTTAQKFTKEIIQAKSIFAKKWFGTLSPFWIFFESLKYYKYYKNHYTIWKYWKWSFKK